MGKKLFIGNLPYEANDQDLMEIFTQVGEVTSAKVIMDKFTGRPRGFAFVITPQRRKWPRRCGSTARFWT